MKIVNQDTLMPIGLAVVIIGSVATWIQAVRGDLASHSNQIQILNKNHEESLKLNWEINGRLSRIEWKLEQDEGAKNGRKTRN